MTNQGLSDVQLHLVDSVEKAQEFLRWMGQRRPFNAVAIDIETGEYPGRHKNDALSPWKGHIRLVQVGDGQQGWAMSWDRWKGVFYEALQSYSGEIVCHNIAFEAKWFEVLSDWRVPWHQVHDTMIMAQIIDPSQSAALKTLTSRLVDPRAAALQGTLDTQLKENGWTWGTVPIDFVPYHAYGALDTVLTMRLFEQFWEHCGPGGAYHRAYEIEMQARKIATYMEINGARVDLDYSQRKLDELTAYTEGVKKWAAEAHGGLSITSSAQLGRTFEGLGAELTVRTPTGGLSMTKEQLDILAATGNKDVRYLAEQVLLQRKADKLASSYFSNFLADNVNGFVHPDIMTMGARTSRMSIRNPALQTLPSGDAVVRDAFIPRDENQRICLSDMDQIELRLMANFSRDENLITLFNDADATGGDAFTLIMREVYHDNTLDKSDKRRKLVKAYVYSSIYGAGIAKQAATAGVSVADMQQLADSFDSRYPGVRFFQKSMENEAIQRRSMTGYGAIQSLDGRMIPVDEGHEFAATNYRIQSSAASLYKQNLIKMDQADLTQFFLAPVHDEIVMSVPLDVVEDVKRTVQECMTISDGWAIPLTAGVDGPFERWGEPYHK